MAGSLLADLSRMGSDNAFTDLVLTAQGGLGRAECQGSKESWCANIGRYTQYVSNPHKYREISLF